MAHDLLRCDAVLVHQPADQLAQETALERREVLAAAEYEAEFGTPEEGTYLIQCEIPQAAKVEIDRRRAETGKTIAQIIADAIEATK